MGRSLFWLSIIYAFAIDAAFAQNGALYQYSTVNALLAGYYDGDLSISQLRQHGDTGLGTINGIDGELIAVDGIFYSIKSDGKAYVLDDSTQTPFAVMAFLQEGTKQLLPADLDYKAMCRWLDPLLAAPNHYHMVRIEGRFSSIKVRSELRQTRPYRPLAEVMKTDQRFYELSKVTGTMIGFKVPELMAGLNVPGYHFHFISENRLQGGHVLDVKTHSGEVRINQLGRFTMDLPEGTEFEKLDLSNKREAELRAVEQQDKQ
jgi:acetolactate decarboxylase